MILLCQLKEYVFLYFFNSSEEVVYSKNVLSAINKKPIRYSIHEKESSEKNKDCNVVHVEPRIRSRKFFYIGEEEVKGRDCSNHRALL